MEFIIEIIHILKYNKGGYKRIIGKYLKIIYSLECATTPAI